MKYDDASWHYGGNFPSDLPDEAGGTHIAMFAAWAVLNGLAGEIHLEDFPESLAKLRTRTLTPGAWLFEACDGKFCDEDLTDEGNAFAREYYGDGTGLRTSAGGYIEDYCDAFPEYPELYAIPDYWETYDRLKPVLDQRFREWSSAN